MDAALVASPPGAGHHRRNLVTQDQAKLSRAITPTGVSTMLNDLATFARRFNVSVADAYVLPALFEGAARKAGMVPSALLTQATYTNNALGEYLAECARKVAIADREVA